MSAVSDTTVSYPPATDQSDLDRAMELYRASCDSIRIKDEVSLKLLAAVPLVTGVGLAFAFPDQHSSNVQQALALMLGIFGALITFAIYRWEVRNIDMCSWFIDCARALEEGPLRFGEAGEMRRPVPHRLPDAPVLTAWGRQLPPKGLKVGKRVAERLLYTTVVTAWLALAIYGAILLATR